MRHTEILQYLIDKYNYKSYLEIGVSCGWNYINLICDNKESNDVIDYDDFLVQEKYDITYLMTSDEMFERMPVDKKYDMIFIDGMHDEEFVDRDIINALKHLNPNGVVCVHDPVPVNAKHQVTYEQFDDGKINELWNGNVWKSITKLQENNLEFYTIQNDDSGLTIIKYKENPYSLKVPDHLSKIKYNYVFNSTNDYNTCVTEQGKYVLHIINEYQFFEIF